MPEVNWSLSLAIGFGMLFGTLLIRLFDWLLGAVGGKR